MNIQIKLYQWNFYSNVFTTLQLFSQQMKSYGLTMQMKCYQQCFHILLFIFSNDLDRLQILDIFLLLDKICFLWSANM